MHAISSTTRASLIIISLALLTPLARLVIGLFDTTLWGLNHTAFYSFWIEIAIVILAIGVYGFIGIFYSGDQRTEPVSEKFNRVFDDTPSRPIIAFAVSAVFWLIGSNHYLFDAGYEQLGRFSLNNDYIIIGYQFLTDHLYGLVGGLFSGLTERALTGGALAFGFIHFVATGFTLWAWFELSQRIGAKSGARGALLALLLCSGAGLGLIAGDSGYVILTALFSWQAVFFVRAIDEKERKVKASIKLVIVTTLAVLFYAQSIFLAPGALFMLALMFRPNHGARRLALLVSLLLVIAVTVITYLHANTDLWVMARLAGLEGKPPEFNYNAHSWERLGDMINTGFVLWPLAPALLLALFKGFRVLIDDRRAQGLFVAAIGGIVWIVISDPLAGSARDVLSVAPFSIPMTALAGLALAHPGKSHHITPLVARGVIYASAISVGLMAPIAISGDVAVEYFNHDYNKLRSARHLNGLIAFRDHYFFKREFQEGDRWENKFRPLSPEYLDHSTVLNLFSMGDLESGLNRLELILRTHKFWPEPYQTKAIGLRAQGRPSDALPVIQSANELRPGNPDILITYGDVLRDLKRFNEAEEKFLLALKIDSTRRTAMTRLGLMYYQIGKFDEALAQADRLEQTLESDPYIHVIRGLVAFERREFKTARQEFETIRSRQAEVPEWQIIQQMISEMDDAGV